MRRPARGWLAAVLTAALTLVAAGEAAAQSAYCERLRADLAALDRVSVGGRSAQAGDAVRQQRAELDRTIAYARSIGCQRQRFLIFGEPPPAQCGSLEAQINRMESNVAALESQADRYGGGAVAQQRAALAAAYDANCRGGQPGLVPPGVIPPQPRQQPGVFERLFDPQDDDNYTTMDPPPPAITDNFGGGAYKTLCVRKCDGYYFPISSSTSSQRFETDSSICQASCPNAEVELYVQPSGQEASAAVALDGTPYTSLPTAFRYRKVFDASCTCRRPGQSWVEALANAERLVGERSTDIVVTEEKSQELSRPREPAAAAAPKPAPKPKAAAAPPPPRTQAPGRTAPQTRQGVPQ